MYDISLNSDYLNEAAICEKEWSQEGFLSDIKDPKVRKMTSVLLENQRLYNERVTDTSDVAQFKRISIPLVRRIFPQLIANKIVSVQPLLGPAGLVYYLRFRYASNKGDMRGATLQATGGYPSDDDASMQQKYDGTTNLKPYYTSQVVKDETQNNAGGGTSLTYTLEKTPVVQGTLLGTVYDGTTAIQTFSTSTSGVISFTDIGTPSPKVTAATLNLATGLVTFTWSADPAANSIICSYEYNMECNQDLPEVNMVIESEQIEVKTRKIKAAWTFEAQQDIRSQHNMDAEAELTAVMAQELNLEIDREILGELLNRALVTTSWDLSTALGVNIKERYESLYVKLVQVSAAIHRRTLRGPANWIVTSPEVAAIFETAVAGFAPIPSETFSSGLGIQYVGTVGRRWQLFKDPNFAQDKILMGYKGDSPFDTGFYYCPYVPLTMTGVVQDPESFNPRKGIMTRYGIKMLREGAKYYGRITVLNYTAV